MQIKMYPSWPNLLGRKQAFVGTSNGPAAYPTGGDIVTLTEYNTSIDYLISGSISIDGTYLIQMYPDSAGPRAVWRAKWILISSGAEAGNGTNLSAQTVILAGFSSGT